LVEFGGVGGGGRLPGWGLIADEGVVVLRSLRGERLDPPAVEGSWKKAVGEIQGGLRCSFRE